MDIVLNLDGSYTVTGDIKHIIPDEETVAAINEGFRVTFKNDETVIHPVDEQYYIQSLEDILEIDPDMTEEEYYAGPFNWDKTQTFYARLLQEVYECY